MNGPPRLHVYSNLREGTCLTHVDTQGTRKYVDYEIERSIARGNGLLGIRVNMLPNQDRVTDPPGRVPERLLRYGASVYAWDPKSFGNWLREAYRAAATRNNLNALLSLLKR